MEGGIRKAKAGGAELEMLYDRICIQVDAQNSLRSPQTRVLLRPLFLDLLCRLEDDGTTRFAPIP